jgi:hypothetical protein
MATHTFEVTLELVGGPLDGQWASVPFGHGLTRIVGKAQTHLYKWSREDTGSFYLEYEGTVA